jgi:hypothetical protein
MKIPLEKINPFGPTILKSKCPKNILDKINSFVDDVGKNEKYKDLYSSSSGNIPNLLLRDFENIFLPYDFCRETGLKELLEKLVDNYTETIGEYKLSPIGNPGLDTSFKNFEEVLYADVWVNRYYSGHYTPIHTHGADISGVIFLDIPEKELYEESIRNIESQGKMYDEYEKRDSGRLLFIYGSNQTFCDNIWKPEQTIGDILIFPSWLNHLVYPQKTNKERRTLSFNIIENIVYYDRMINYYGDYQGD